MPLTTYAEFIVTFLAGICVGGLIYNQYGQESDIEKLEKRIEKLERSRYDVSKTPTPST